MSFINEIYSTISNDEQCSEKKATFFSVINYLVVNDDVTGVKRKDIDDRFSLRQNYRSILQQLADKNIISEDSTTVSLKDDAKSYLRPILQTVLAKSYSSKYNTSALLSSSADSPDVSLLLDCRSQLYKST